MRKRAIESICNCGFEIPECGAVDLELQVVLIQVRSQYDYLANTSELNEGSNESTGKGKS